VPPPVRRQLVVAGAAQGLLAKAQFARAGQIEPVEGSDTAIAATVVSGSPRALPVIKAGRLAGVVR
jgi:hypothetical protein